MHSPNAVYLAFLRFRIGLSPILLIILFYFVIIKIIIINDFQKVIEFIDNVLFSYQILLFDDYYVSEYMRTPDHYSFCYSYDNISF